jgi:hypothetical protein
MPVLVLAAKLCPPGSGGNFVCHFDVHFQRRRCCWRSGGRWSNSAVRVTRDDFGNLALLIAVSSLSSQLPLPLLSLLPDESPDADGAWTKID